MIPKRLRNAQIGDTLVFRDSSVLHAENNRGNITYSWNSEGRMDYLISENSFTVDEKILRKINNDEQDMGPISRRDETGYWTISLDMLKL